MEQKDRIILVVAIAVVLLAAVFVSFGLPSLTGRIPEVTLPNLTSETEEAGQDTGFSPVPVTPENVQSVVATLARPESCARDMTVTLFWQTGSAMQKVRLWTDGAYSKTEITFPDGQVQNRLTDGKTLCLWYQGDRNFTARAADADTPDLMQRIPTWEDVLAIAPSQITAADYQRRQEHDCIHVEVQADDARQESYWIETATGLLYAAEVREEGRIVYTAEETGRQIPLEGGVSFALPDGTVWHTSAFSAVQQEQGSQ